MREQRQQPVRGKRRGERPRGLGRALGLTCLAAFLPAAVLAAAGGYLVRERRAEVLEMAFRPGALVALSIGLVVGWLLWIALICATYLRHRPRVARDSVRVAGTAAVALICLVITLPMAVGTRYAVAQRDVITTVFRDEHTATAPDVTKENPWGRRTRVNVLLLGGDGAVHRPGVRTDSVMLASINVESGDTVLFSLPRNLQRVPFPEGTPLAEEYPDGFTGPHDLSDYLLNAVYGNVPAWYPGINGPSENEGADAVKQAVSGALGIPVDYYALVNLDGFESIVDAIGGITVDINEPIPIGGDESAGREPDDWIEPGPDQRLDGFHALWFARGRYGSSDYSRMQRQRCAVRAIVHEARPWTLFRRYTALAEAGKKLVRTDIPQDLLPAFVELGTRMKDGRLKSVGFELGDDFNPNDPDYEYVERRVAHVIAREQDPERPAETTPPAEDGSEVVDPDAGPDADPAATEASDTAADCSYQPDEDELGVSTTTDEMPRGMGDPLTAP